MKIEQVWIGNWQNAFWGMRAPRQSWDVSDTTWNCHGEPNDIGPKDLDLAERLARAGGPHAKFRRQILISFVIWAPLKWWTEFETYIATAETERTDIVRDSCSTLHLHRPFCLEDFEVISPESFAELRALQDAVLDAPVGSDERRDAEARLGMAIPASFILGSSLSMNYEVLSAIYKWRKNHRLPQWREFCKWIETLPHAKELICSTTEKK
jgi:hypothetical protein